VPTSEPVDYALADGVATITLDDGKANVLSPAMLAAIDQALDQAEQDEAVVVLRGRPGRFSAGYDLGVFQSGDGQALTGMLRAGGRLVARLLDFPRPVLGACTGHAIAQGAFTLLGCDVRIGVAGDFKLGMNEAANGMTLPRYAVTVSRYRLRPDRIDLALGAARMVGPQQAADWGILDEVVAEDAFDQAVAEEAARLATLSPGAHRGIKQHVRGDLVQQLRDDVDAEFPAA
jgi:enoyl-CoA hydratase